MPNLNHRFSSGRMNKDLDERLVPNGEYRDALNIEVATSDTSDMGTVQTVMGNLNMSLITIDPNNTGEFYCVGSVVNEQHDKIYWMLAGRASDIIAEYDYKTQTTTPVVVDLFPAGTIPGNESGRVLNFDRAFTITGINIIENMLFWTDNYSEPKRIHIDRCKLGTSDFTSQTQLYVRDISTNNASIDYYPKGNLTHEHITVIKKSPPAPPVLEMRNKLRVDQNPYGTNFATDFLIGINGNFTTDPGNPFFDSGNDPIESLLVTFNPNSGIFNQLPDFVIGDIINIYVGVNEAEDNSKFVRAEILSYDVNTGAASLKVLSGTKTIISISGEWYVELEQAEPLFQFKFPRFGIRYKYEDGEYSSFSPFSQVAFLPQEFDYLPKEGYNLGMVNNLRFLAIRDFVHGQSIPDDVISVDILYKESNSPNIYTVKTIKRLENDWVPGFEPWSNNIFSLDDVTANYSEWNAIGPKDTVGSANGLVPGQLTRGWTRITSEMIHAILPSNQLLRPYDNVPRVALAQEVVGNRLVYGNYLQNYNMFNRFAVHTKALEHFNEFNFGELDPESQISVDIKTSLSSKSAGENGQLLPEQSNPFYSYFNVYLPAKSIKTLRTYQLGVAYIDEYGRETPVFSNSTIDKASLYVEKIVADKKNRLQAQLFNTHPEWAKSFKFFVKETSNEYYNLAMDRWYDAEDGNIWISFPSSERNKIDEETFLILKKEHDNNNFVSSPARYKVIAIENEAPTFVKTSTLAQPTFLETQSSPPFDIGGSGTFPEIGASSFLLDNLALTSSGWETTLNLGISNPPNASKSIVVRDFDIRMTGTSGSANFSSNWYRLKSISKSGSTDHLFTIFKKFEADINVLSPTGTSASYTGGGRIELRKRVIDNKPEFDGRFFVKIRRDAELEQTIIKPVGSSINWQIADAMRVQYINPDSDFSKSIGSDGFFGVWNQASIPEQAISLADTVGDGDGCGTDVQFQEEEKGRGQAYWELASHNTDSSTADSSGWFIDKIEGFRRFKTTTHYFGQNNNDPWLTKHEASVMKNAGGAVEDFYYYWEDSGYNWNGSPGGSNGNAKNRFDMPVVMGTATHSSSDTGSYLNLNHTDRGFGGSRPDDANVNGPSYIGTSGGTSFPGASWLDPSFSNNFHVLDDNGDPIPGKAFNEQAIINNIDGFADHINQSVLRTGLNGYLQHVGQSFADLGTIGSLAGNGGGILPSLGIDGHPDAGSAGGANPDHTGLLKGVNSYQGTNIITISHAGVGGDVEVDDPEGKDAPSQGGSVADLVLALEFGQNQTNYIDKHVKDISFINALRTPGATWRWAEDPGQVVYKTIDPTTVDLSGWGITTTEIAINFGNDPLDGEPGVGLYNYCSLGDWADGFLMWGEDGNSADRDYLRATMVSQGAGSMSEPAPDDYVYVAMDGYSTIGQPHWKYSDAYTNPGSNWKDEYVEVAISNNCGGWQVRSYNTAAHGMWPMYVKDWWKAINRRRRFMIVAESYDGGLGLGETAPHHYLPTNDPTLDPHFDSNEAVKTTLPTTPAPGIRSDGVYSGYSTGNGDVPYGPTKEPDPTQPAPLTNDKFPGSVTWQILSPYVDTDSETYSSTNPAIFETEPKENVDLNIYYEVGQIYPIELNEKTGEQFVGPIHPSIPLAPLNSKVTCYDPNPVTNPAGNFRGIQTGGAVLGLGAVADIRVESLQDNVLTLCDVDGGKLNTNLNPTATLPQSGDRLIFSRSDGGKTETGVLNVNAFTGEIELDRAVHNYKVTLPWHNCYSFGNGVESDRIRDDFNQVTIDNGPKASATLEEPYEEERRGSGLIYSGIYNSMSGVNNLNQFIQAEKITKDLNPIYGTIQKLHTRDTNLVTLCEDKIFKILANKDALFNADGNSNVTATDRVLGATTPFLGDFGISQNPESFVAESYRAYFTDKVRGQVLRLSQDGITPISDAGMGDWFSDNLKLANRLIGSYDEKKDEYNLTLDHNEYPIAQPVQVIDNFMVEIESENCGCGGNYDVPTGRIITSIQQSVVVGMVLNGPSLATNTVVTAVTPNFSQLILTVNPEPTFIDVVSLFGPNPSGWQTHVALGTQPDAVSTYTNTSGNYDLTVSFSERSKGWTSFKSWAQENGVSLNNTYYTFKGGHIHEHHVESQPRNNFYSIPNGQEFQYDSSIEVLFNESPEIVKSFNTLNYEGTQSRVTPDTENSGEYWDNYLHAGWYVSNMLTNLQEGSMQEFREKEGKWFSQIKGVTTQWLDDGKAGNIDTREFSYQGIDEADDIRITSGGYTSYDCRQLATATCNNFIDVNAANTVNRPRQVIQLNELLAGVDNWFIQPNSPHLNPVHLYGPMIMWLIDNHPDDLISDYAFEFVDKTGFFGQGAGNPQTAYWFFGSDDDFSLESLFPHPSHYAGPTHLKIRRCREFIDYLNSINAGGHSNWDLSSSYRPGVYSDYTVYLQTGDNSDIITTSSPGQYTLERYNQLDVWMQRGSGVYGSFCSAADTVVNPQGYFCVELQNQNGQYPTLSACEAVCGVNQETYECISGECVDPGDGSGSYSTYCECVNDSLCCNEGLAYAYTCQNIAEPTPVIYGCMDDGITTDLYTTRFRPSNWSVNTDYGGPSLGAASNYYPAANTPDCSCQYNTPPPPPETFDCSGITGATITLPDGTTQYIAPYTCYDPEDGTGQYTNPGAVAAGYIDAQDQCDQNCQPGPCNHLNYFSQVQINVINADSTNNCTNGEILVSVGQILIHDLEVELQDLFGNVLQTATVSQSNPQSVSFTGLFGPQDYIIEIYETGSGTQCGYSYQREVLCTQIPACNSNNFNATTTVTQNFVADDCTDHTTIISGGTGTFTLSVPNNGYGQPNTSDTFEIIAVRAIDDVLNQGAPTQDITSSVLVNGANITGQQYNIGSTVFLSNISFTAAQANSFANNNLSTPTFRVVIQDSNGCGATVEASITCTEPTPESFNCVLDNDGISVICVDPLDGTGYFSVANGFSSPQSACNMAAQNQTTPCDLITYPDYNCVLELFDGGTSGYSCIPVAPGTGLFTGPTAQADCNNAVANNQSPCDTLPPLPEHCTGSWPGGTPYELFNNFADVNAATNTTCDDGWIRLRFERLYGTPAPTNYKVTLLRAEPTGVSVVPHHNNNELPPGNNQITIWSGSFPPAPPLNATSTDFFAGIFTSGIPASGSSAANGDELYWDGLLGGYGNPVDGFGTGQPTHYYIRIEDDQGCYQELGPYAVAGVNGCDTNPGGGTGTTNWGGCINGIFNIPYSTAANCIGPNGLTCAQDPYCTPHAYKCNCTCAQLFTSAC